MFLKNLTTLRDSSILDSSYPLYMYFVGLNDIPTDATSYTEMKIDLSFTAINMHCIPDVNNFVENSQKVSFLISVFIQHEFFLMYVKKYIH